MPLEFAFHRSIAEQQLLAIHNREPVAPSSSDGWSYQELLQLSASATLAAIACGPPEPSKQPAETDKLSRKDRVKIFCEHKTLIAAIVKLFTDITGRVTEPEEYDLFYDPIVVGTATLDESESGNLRIVEMREQDGYGGHHAEVLTHTSTPARVEVEITRGARDAESRKVEVMVLV